MRNLVFCNAYVVLAACLVVSVEVILFNKTHFSLAIKGVISVDSRIDKFLIEAVCNSRKLLDSLNEAYSVGAHSNACILALSGGEVSLVKSGVIALAILRNYVNKTLSLLGGYGVNKGCVVERRCDDSL